MKQLVAKETIDFRTVAPLMLGLSKIFYKKLNYLISDSATTLDQLRNPFQDIVKKEEPYHYRADDGKKTKKQVSGDKYVTASKFFNIGKLKMPGLPAEDLDAILKAVDQDINESISRMRIKQEDDSIFAPPLIDEVRGRGEEFNIRMRDDAGDIF